MSADSAETENHVVGYFDDESRDLMGHSVRGACVTEDGQSRVKYECQECGLLSNSVTGFDQRSCDSDTDDVDRGRNVAADGGEVEPGWVSVELDAEDVDRVIPARETVERDYSEDGYQLFIGANGLNDHDLEATFEEKPEPPVELQIHPYLAKSVVNKDHVEYYSYTDEGVSFTVAGKRVEDEETPDVMTDGGQTRPAPDPEILDVVPAPEGECHMWSGDESPPSRCDSDADYLFVYQCSTDPETDIRKNALVCEECFTLPDEYDEDVERGRGVVTDGGQSAAECSVCGGSLSELDRVAGVDACEDCRPEVATDGGITRRRLRVGPARTVAYGPAGTTGDDWTLRFTTDDGDRVSVQFDEDAMYELWTEVHHVPWPSREDDRHDLQRELVVCAERADTETLREALDVFGGESQ